MDEQVSTEYLIGFTEGTAAAIVDYVAAQLTRRLGRDSVQRDWEKGEEPTQFGLPEDCPRLIVVRVTRAKIAQEAQHLGYLKPRSTMTRGERSVEVAGGASGPPPGLPLLTDFQYDSHLFDAASPDFWTKAEEAQLTRSIIENISFGDDFPALLREHLPKASKQLVSSVAVTQKLPAALRIAGLLQVFCPMHTPASRATVWKRSRLSLATPVQPSADGVGVQGYFGWHVAFYFEWMNFFTLWLLAPAVVGFGFYLHIQATPYTVDDHPYLPFFSLFVILWAVLFVSFWDRHAAACAWRWGVYGHETQEEVRPEFRGELVDNEVTCGQTKVRRYPYTKRLLAYGVSAVVTGCMLCVAFLVMVCSLNLQGYIDGKLWWERPLHFEPLAALALPGEIFDPNQTEYFGLLAFGPVILHVIVIMMLNKLYRGIAEWLTVNENHRLEEDHENSLVLKRFFFEAFDCYIALFYVGFVQQDIRKLRAELMALYTVDTLRRVATETLIPQLVRLWTKRQHRRLDEKLKKHDKGHVAAAMAEMEADQYEIFDDYLEMVIEFGYVILFAAAFPLASLLSVVCNFVEVKSDLWKLTKVYQRPPCTRASNIGVWRTVLRALVVLSVFTNVMLFATSEQLAAHFPSLYREAEMKDLVAGRVASLDDTASGTVDLVIAKGKGRWVVLIAVAFEHIVYLLVALVRALIPKEPEWVSTQVARLEYEKDQALREQLRAGSSLSLSM